MARTINMSTSSGCKYSAVPDDVAVAAFQAGGMVPFVAEHNVSMLRLVP